MLTALPTASIIRAALWGFGQLFPFSEFFDNPGKSLIQSAKYLLSWFRIGRYQCPPRKELQDTWFATSPTRHRIAGCERSVRAVRFPETQVSIVSIALRDQLIHNILVWRAVQRESLTRQGNKAGKIRVRTGRESDRLRWEPEEKITTSILQRRSHLSFTITLPHLTHAHSTLWPELSSERTGNSLQDFLLPTLPVSASHQQEQWNTKRHGLLHDLVMCPYGKRQVTQLLGSKNLTNLTVFIVFTEL